MKWLMTFLKFLSGTLFTLALLGLTAVVGAYYYFAPVLPSPESLRDVQFQVPLRVYSHDRLLIAEFGEKRRIPLKYKEFPQQLVQAFLAAEDNRFFQHPGVDYQGILRAAIQLAMTGEKKQGGSTITMQVARNFFLSPEKTYTRKLIEILLAFKIESSFTKEEILELYLNKIYLGHRAYGVGAAAQVYYGKTVDQLDLSQIAMIAGLPKAPSKYNPITDPARALERRDYVLGQMRKLDYISLDDYKGALSSPVSASLHYANIDVEAPYVAEMVRSELFEEYGENIYTDGLSVYTTIDSHRQSAANRALRFALQEYDQRHGYRGAEQELDITNATSLEALDTLLGKYVTVGDLRPAIVTAIEEKSAEIYLGNGNKSKLGWEGLRWAHRYKSEDYRGLAPKKASEIVKPGDLIRVVEEKNDNNTILRLAQIPKIEGALVSLDPNDGAVTALVGGYDFFQSKFNRAIQAERQPGSGFKAFIYSAALEAGFTPASLINDAPVVFNDPSLEGAWRPKNYSGKFFGPTRLRMALTKSRNLVSIRLLRSMGIEHALKHVSLFGFDSDKLPHNLSLALGSGIVTPLQMASAYAILANGGYRVAPYFIEKIEDNQQRIVFQAEPPRVCENCPDSPPTETTTTPNIDNPKWAPRVISAENYYLMNSMLRDVVNYGTATKARILGRGDIAGKTGTTNDQKDAWFNGFNRSQVAVVWVGFDSAKPLGRGEVGGKAALPAWIEYMKEALKDTKEIPLEAPPGIVTMRIDPRTGKRATSNQKDALFEAFFKGNTPTERALSPPILTGNGEKGAQRDEDPF
ncbi:MAG: penicillin-binding protein 1A [Gammaproteobacteria bacterium]|nr:penicillin-binding protein 1A [Gammaproteobacteria bacterium]